MSDRPVPETGERELTDFGPVEQVCWLASLDGGRVDMRRERSRRAQHKIDEALDAGAIDRGGWLTALGWEIARSADG